jgi:Protein of unknown function (DUF1257)
MYFSELRTKICDVDALKLALADLGYEVKENDRVRGSFENYGCIRADIIAILDRESGDIGWKQNKDGTYTLVADLLGLAKRNNPSELIGSIQKQYEIRVKLKNQANGVED